MIRSAWRIIRGDEVILGSDSHPDGFNAGAAALRNATVDWVVVSAPFHDIEVRFSNGISLKTFANSERYEHWHFLAGPNEIVVAGPGVAWSTFESSH